MQCIHNKLSTVRNYRYNNILSKPEVKNALRSLQKNFVLIPVDKASKNIAVVCKKSYIQVMNDEIENSPTFEHLSDDDLSIFVNNLKSRLNFKFDNCKLPTMYATAKMQKFPKKFRYITSGRNTLLSSLSESVGMCLKLVVKFARTSFKYRIQGIDNCIFIVDNRDKVIDFIDTSNQVGLNKCVSSWDFATLYTKIPHDKLIDKMSGFIAKGMDGVATSNKAARCICRSKTGAYFSKSRCKKNVCYSKEELIKYVKIIVDNCYVVYHDKIFRQVIGIPMGTSCAPYLANIFLHIYEYDYLREFVEKGEMENARRLANTFRYQDDCIALNHNGEFEKHFSKIYPSEMKLESTNLSKCVITFLDLRISIFRSRFLYRSYDKRDNFNFAICNYPHLDGNVPLASSYGVFMSQLVRFCNINQQVKGFINDLVRQFHNFCDKYLIKWSKYGVDISRFLSLIFPAST